jgi:hypothetical protein
MCDNRADDQGQVQVPAQCLTTPVAIREGVLEDIPNLVALLAELFLIEADFEPDSKKQEAGLHMLLNSPKDCILVAVSGKQVFTVPTYYRQGVPWTGVRSLVAAALQLVVARLISYGYGFGYTSFTFVASHTIGPSILLCGGQVVGMVSIQTLLSTAEGGRVGLLEDFIVSFSARGQGMVYIWSLQLL